jgi:hypothetical protein
MSLLSRGERRQSSMTAIHRPHAAALPSRLDGQPPVPSNREATEGAVTGSASMRTSLHACRCLPHRRLPGPTPWTSKTQALRFSSPISITSALRRSSCWPPASSAPKSSNRSWLPLPPGSAAPDIRALDPVRRALRVALHPQGTTPRPGAPDGAVVVLFQLCD